MNERQIKEAVFEAIVRVAPEADPAQGSLAQPISARSWTSTRWIS